MKIIVGQILKTKTKVEAYQIYDTSTKTVELTSLEKCKNMVAAGNQIVGLKAERHFSYTAGKDIINVNIERGKFNMTKIPVINGKAELINPEDGELLTVIGWKGFAEEKKYHLVDYKGQIYQINTEEFENKVKDRKVNGAFIKNGRLLIMNCLNKEMEV